MRVARQSADGHSVRVIAWGGGATTDLSAVITFVVVLVVCAGSIVGATQTSGWARGVFTVLALLSGILWIAIAGTLLVIGVVLAALRAHRITSSANALMTALAAGLGAAIGTGAYEAGPVALAVTPAVAIAGVCAVWSTLPSRRARIRTAWLAVVMVAAATAVGATVFV